MTYLPIMKRIACSLFIFFLLTGAARAAEFEAGLFTPYEGPLQLDPLSVNPALVLRQRLVSIRFGLLPMAEGQVGILNLFDDVVVRAICDSVEANTSDGFVWNGHIQGMLGSLVTLTVGDQALAGTVVLPTLIYHIRSSRDHAHVVREIRHPVQRTTHFFAESAPSSAENEVAELVNLEREIENLHPLVWDNALGSAARDHSTDMAQQNYFSHTSLDGRVFNQRITAAGYACSACGENIAAGYSNPQAVMNGWMNSPGHRANILNSTFCDLGVGYAFRSSSNYGHYWTQDFGRRQGVSVCTLAEYTIIATAGLHGRIHPSGSVKVQSGANQTFQITPDAGYRILEVKVDSVSIEPVATYTFSSVAKNHSIEVNFEETGKGAKPAHWIPLLLLDD
jgi:uncharacterized protein YkwD